MDPDQNNNPNEPESPLHTEKGSAFDADNGGSGGGVADKLGSLPGNAFKTGKGLAQKAGEAAGDASGGGLGSLKDGLGKVGGSVPGLGSSDTPGSGGQDSAAGATTDGAKKAISGLKNSFNPTNKTPGQAGVGGGNGSESGSMSGGKKSGGKEDKNPIDDLMKKEMQGAKDTAKVAVDVGRTLVGDERALIKYANPVKTAKTLKSVIIFLCSIIFIAGISMLMIVGIIGYKLQAITKSVDDVVSQIPMAGTAKRMAETTTDFLMDNAGAIGTALPFISEDNSGVVFAQENPASQEEYAQAKSTPNPPTKKLYEAWDKAGLANIFAEKYGGRIIINRESAAYKSGNLKDKSAWNLYVGSILIGPLDGSKAQGYIGKFSRETTHWKDIYNRVATRSVAQQEFNYKDTKLDYPDEGFNLEKTRHNIVQSITGLTLSPVSEKGSQYYSCLLVGGNPCQNLGLGSKNTPLNSGGSEEFMDDLNKDALINYSKDVSNELAQNVGGPGRRSPIVSRILTGSANSVLEGFPKVESGLFRASWFLDAQDRVDEAINNSNFSRVLYDRITNQNVMQGMNYYVGGGQIANGDMSLMNTGVLTDNLNSIEESPVFRAAFMGENGVYAQGNTDTTPTACQKIFNDTKPAQLDNATEQRDRGIKETACIRKGLLPNPTEYVNQMSKDAVFAFLSEDARADKVVADTRRDCGISLPGEILEFDCSTYTTYYDEAIASVLEVANNTARLSKVGINQLTLDQDLAPNLDGNTNQVYGSNLSGAETNGAAFDTVWATGEVLWNNAVIDGKVGMGGAYLSNEQSAQALRYAVEQRDTELAHTPLTERLFSLSQPRSLTTRLAMLAPTNPESGGQKLAALFSPQNLTYAFTTQFSPRAMAADTTLANDANPMDAIRFGYAIDDPSNTMESSKLWNDYRCDNPPAQELATPDGLPFNVPVSVNPCQREEMLSVVGSCWFNDEDCTPAAQTSAPTNSGTPPSSGVSLEDTAVTRNGGGIRVWKGIVTQLEAMIDSASAAGYNLTASGPAGGWRDPQAQIELRKQNCGTSQYDIFEKPSGQCSPPTAIPGSSNHEKGVAIDFRCNGSSIGQFDRSNPCVVWLTANAATYGFKPLASEAWHWSINGG